MLCQVTIGEGLISGYFGFLLQQLCVHHHRHIVMSLDCPMRGRYSCDLPFQNFHHHTSSQKVLTETERDTNALILSVRWHIEH